MNVRFTFISGFFKYGEQVLKTGCYNQFFENKVVLASSQLIWF